MQETVSINGLTLCHKHSDGWVRSTLPDVCRSPDKPVPYTNTAYARDLAKGTTTVFSHGGAMNGIKGSEFYRSFGDEPGSGGGVKSGVHLDRATWLSWSPNVFMEGRNVTRLTDRMLLNKGNTISAGGYFTGPVRDEKNREFLDQICKAACECLAAGTMNGRCVAEKIRDWAKQNNRNIEPEVAWDLNNGEWSMRRRADGTIMRGGGKRPIDFIDLDNMAGTEYKGPRDRMRGRQSDYIDEITEQHDMTREDVNFKDDCDCSGGGSAPAPVTETSQVSEKSPASLTDDPVQWAKENPWKAAGVGVAAGVVTGGAIYYGGAIVTALLGGTALVTAAAN
ncbi:DUF4150 domain-containing protein [Agrobacterium vitis]|uniref:DUF4150 domain-containing protein n=1 Tax=Agrobacterium vitis TaxID=373 RepID=A0ABD6G506_AGRVI|nr:DUF4150 domain-containing protein [Agrobacterium vitis]MUO80207.1 DUF4150 domain-containing protein [Agrobacterium vitis]MUO97149.1 DUF4150 domain-containing protein [Agrobacterium vitis]MUP03675.1 DUF4150 domain-containing protein [Agrobacterium vitis]MUZ82643.1 DUF4150 domain-containing protein [Agrobacterium vitis]MVA09984.1 DUF4150 domain-containing protein [Agrobacterium vitis]